jgi:hypothetical protein
MARIFLSKIYAEKGHQKENIPHIQACVESCSQKNTACPVSQASRIEAWR